MFDIDLAITSEGLVMRASPEARRELADTLIEQGFWTTLADMLEPYFTNGSYQPFDAGQGNPFVGLTDAPCIAEHLDVDDDGTQEIVGRFWLFPNYMVECPIETLIEKGTVTWRKA